MTEFEPEPTHSPTATLRGRLLDPSRVEHVLAVSAAVGGLTLLDPARVGAGGRIGLRGANAGLVGLLSWSSFRSAGPPFDFAPLWPAGGAALGAGLSLSLAESGEALDARLQSSLLRRGVGRPRLWMAAAAAAATALALVVTRPREAPYGWTAGSEAEEVDVELPDQARALASVLLAGTEQWGAPELREQLARARAQESLGENEAAFYPGLSLVVPDELSRAVPAEGRFPVFGRYHPFGGRSGDLYLSVSQGRLAHLSIGPGDDWSEDDELEWTEAGGSLQDVTRWPEPGELTLMVDTLDGPRPLG